MCSFCNCVIWERINRWCNGSTDKSELERREFDSHWGFLNFTFHSDMKKVPTIL